MSFPIYIPRCEQTPPERALAFKDNYATWKQNVHQYSHLISGQAFLTSCCICGIASAIFTCATVYALAPGAGFSTYAVSLILSVPSAVAVGAIATSLINSSEAQI